MKSKEDDLDFGVFRERKKRICLRCDRAFISHGQRLCWNCRQRNKDQDEELTVNLPFTKGIERSEKEKIISSGDLEGSED